MRIALLGANGRTGQQFVLAAVSRGHEVRGLVRDASIVELQTPGYKVIEGDARRSADVIALAEGCDAIVSTLGSHSGALGPLYGQAAEAIVAAAQADGVARVVVLSTRALGDTAAAGDDPAAHRASSSEVHDDLRAMERTLRDAPIALTIMRPSRLVDGPLGAYEVRVGALFPRGHETRRADLADAMMRAVDEGVWVDAEVAIVSR